MSVSPLKLPPEVTLQILSFLDYNSLKTMRQVCRTWKFFLEERSLWKNFAEIGNDYHNFEEINRNILNWKDFADRVLNEGTIADIICFINMIKTYKETRETYPSCYPLELVSIKSAAFSPGK